MISLKKIVESDPTMKGKAGIEAKRMGLDDMRFGRYGKDGHVTHIVDKTGKLVAKPASDATPTSRPSTSRSPDGVRSDVPLAQSPKGDYGNTDMPTSMPKTAGNTDMSPAAKAYKDAAIRYNLNPNISTPTPSSSAPDESQAMQNALQMVNKKLHATKDPAEITRLQSAFRQISNKLTTLQKNAPPFQPQDNGMKVYGTDDESDIPDTGSDMQRYNVNRGTVPDDYTDDDDQYDEPQSRDSTGSHHYGPDESYTPTLHDMLIMNELRILKKNIKVSTEK